MDAWYAWPDLQRVPNWARRTESAWDGSPAAPGKRGTHTAMAPSARGRVPPRSRDGAKRTRPRPAAARVRRPAPTQRGYDAAMPSLYLGPWRIDVEWRDGVPRLLPATVLAGTVADALDAAGAPRPASLGLILSDDAELVRAAAAKNVKITDVRKNNFRQIARREGINPNCLRVHTVGHDCSVGKMVVSLELARGLKERGRDAQFVATGQTGIMVAGAGLPLDCIVADFVSGGAEQLVLDNQHHELIIVEGQGSLVHPSYSGVTLSLLHGCLPHALVFVFEAGRDCVGGLEQVRLPSLAEQRKLFETMGSIYQPCSTIGFAMNGRKLSPEDAHRLAQQLENEMQLPVVDVIRDGADRLLDAVERFHSQGNWR